MQNTNKREFIYAYTKYAIIKDDIELFTYLVDKK